MFQVISVDQKKYYMLVQTVIALKCILSKPYLFNFFLTLLFIFDCSIHIYIYIFFFIGEIK